MNYIELIEKGLKCHYYRTINDNVSLYDIITEPNNYIEAYFKIGGKIDAILIDDIPLLKNKKRATHMCALYALGAYLISNSTIKDQIEKTYEHVIPLSLGKHYHNDALYYWYLVSLYHDIGYNNDEIILDYDVLSYKFSIRKFVEDIKEINLHEHIFIKYFDDRFDNAYQIRKAIRAPYHQYINHYEYNPYVFNSYYHPKIYLRYYKYRNKDLIDDPYENLEHGVYGGRLFFNNILKSIKNSMYSCDNIRDEYLHDKNNNLVWFPEQLDIFRDIALSIATHNIWKKTFKEYFPRNGFRRIRKNNPLLYLLCVCDNIDLYKHLMYKFSDEEIMQKMRSIDITFANDIIKIKTNQNDMRSYLKNIEESLKDYIDIMCEYKELNDTYMLEVYL